jgi:hypothetical protein
VDILALDDHVSQVDADAEFETLVFIGGRLVRGDAGLPRQGTRKGIDHAGMLDQQAVAHELHDAAMVLGDERLQDLLTKFREAPKRARLVGTHQ